MQAIAQPDLLVGQWHILHWHEIYEDGRISLPFGNALRGFLRYEHDGHMMCIISKPARAAFASNNQYEASAIEKARAYEDFFVYAGRYERDGNFLAHYVDFALFPNWQDTVQNRRIASLGPDHLCLEADKRGASVTPHIVQIAWQRTES